MATGICEKKLRSERRKVAVGGAIVDFVGFFVGCAAPSQASQAPTGGRGGGTPNAKADSLTSDVAPLPFVISCWQHRSERNIAHSVASPAMASVHTPLLASSSSAPAGGGPSSSSSSLSYSIPAVSSSSSSSGSSRGGAAAAAVARGDPWRAITSAAGNSDEDHDDNNRCGPHHQTPLVLRGREGGGEGGGIKEGHMTIPRSVSLFSAPLLPPPRPAPPRTAAEDRMLCGQSSIEELAAACDRLDTRGVDRTHEAGGTSRHILFI